MQKIVDFFKEVKNEVQKVEWPGRQEMIYSFMLVVLGSLAMSFIFFVVDWFFLLGIDKTLSLAAGG